MFVAQGNDALATWLGMLPLVVLAMYGSWVLFSRLARGFMGGWRMVSVEGDFTSEHHLPESIPVPKAEATRVATGEFSFDEAVRWIELFVKKRPLHARRAELQGVLHKAAIYREMAGKMGRGLWRDVDRLGQRLSELDPLDPSALVARGRAMRELGNFAGAIRLYQKALELSPFHSTAFPEMAATCRAIGQPGRFRAALEKAKQELGETHPLTIEGRIQLGELVRVYADPTDPATLAHIPREQYLQNAQTRLDELTLDPTSCLQVGQTMLADDMPELAESLAKRCESEFGSCAEAMLLAGMVERYRFNYESAERHVRAALDQQDMAEAHLELGRILLDKARTAEEPKEARDSTGESEQELRLAVDREPNLYDAIKLLVEPRWEKGIESVVAAIRPLFETYPQAWGPWRVLGDAYATAGQQLLAIDSYRRGLKIADADQLILPCIDAMQQVDQKRELLQFARKIEHLQERDPQVRWKVAQVFFDSENLREARRVLQNLVDDERVPPPLRQRANEVLDHLDSVERKRIRRTPRKRKDSEQ